jgi:hypothetical protein
MRYPIGHLTTATAFRSGAAYKTQVKNFNIFGEPTGETITIRAATEGSGLGTSYTFTHVYSTNTGLHIKDVYSTQGGLPAETVNYSYSGPLDLPDTVNGLTGYANGTTYDAFGRINQETIGPQPTAGNITRQTSTRLGATAPTETQCYAYDQLARLTTAWTATDACAATPTPANHFTVGDGLGTASTYWTSWSLDALGDRTSQNQHGLNGAADAVTNYTYNGNAAGQSHTLTATNTTCGASASTSYAYDAAGNMITRTSCPRHPRP